MLTAEKELTMKRTLIFGATLALFTSTSVSAASNSNLAFEYQAKRTPHSIDITQPININKASRIELMSLQGIDLERAKSIINFRINNGEFNSFTELALVEGVGGKLIEINISQLTGINTSN